MKCRSARPDPSRRANLGFADATRSAFEFLGEHGFAIVSAQPTFVRFESPSAFVNVFHGRASYELGVEVGRWLRRCGELIEQKFALSDIIELSGAAADAGLRPLATREADAVHRFVSLLADWTKTYAERALSGDEVFFMDLSARAAERSNELQEVWRAEQLRADAEEAWRRKDYVAVVAAYNALAELRSISLTESELGRLRYARKRS